MISYRLEYRSGAVILDDWGGIRAASHAEVELWAEVERLRKLLRGIARWIDEHPSDPVPPACLLDEARDAGKERP